MRHPLIALAPALTACLLAACAHAPRAQGPTPLRVQLPADAPAGTSGRLLVFAEPAADALARAKDEVVAAVDAILHAARPDTAALAILAIPQALEAGEIIARLKAINPAISVLARAHSEAEVKHLLAHGADAAVLAERELAYSLADMVMSTPPYRPARVEAAAVG